MNKRWCLAAICSGCLLTLALGMCLLKLWYPQHVPWVVGNTASMSPTLKAGERVLARPFDPASGGLQRYQIVVFRSPLDPAAHWAMRVVGLPGERLEIGTNSFAINGSTVADHGLPKPLRRQPWLTPRLAELSTRRQWTLGPRELFVVGDNLSSANDSRFWGPLDLTNVTGVVEFVP